MDVLANNELLNFEITPQDLSVEDLLASPFIYEQQLIKFLLTPRICVTSANMNTTLEYLQNKVLKIEGLEKLSSKLHSVCAMIAQAFDHNGPVTCHLFQSPENALSFPIHTDPDDVYLYVVSGTKTMIVDGIECVIEKGERLFIPKNTPHQAINNHPSQMLSFGLERFLQDKL